MNKVITFTDEEESTILNALDLLESHVMIVENTDTVMTGISKRYKDKIESIKTKLDDMKLVRINKEKENE